MAKIEMKTPLVEMDGDEMTRIIWQQIKQIVLQPFIALKTEYFDLGLKNRDLTADKVTVAAAKRTRELGVAVKCATITPNQQRLEEYGLKKMWASPNATIRSILGGTVFRAPIQVDSIRPFVSTWQKPITIARHAYGDIYAGAEKVVSAPCRAELLLTQADGRQEKILVHDFAGPGILLAMHNLDSSIEDFARACFNFALLQEQDLWFSAKDTISKHYDHRFKDIFAEIFAAEFASRFSQAGIEYFYTLIDDAVARAIRSPGGFVWALKNYDGDVLSDLLASANGSLAMMTSVLMAPDGSCEFEAAHGTVTRHYYRHLKGEKTSTNPMATLFAWSGALKRAGQIDQLPDLIDFANRLEETACDLIDQGTVTGDLKDLVRLDQVEVVDTTGFLTRIADKLSV